MSASQASPISGIDDGGPAQTGDLVFHQDSPTPLIIRKGVRETICSHVDEGMRALRRGGAEVGGLLIAPKTSGGSVSVEQLVTIPIEYRFGPSFRLSASDFNFLEQMVAAVQERSSDAVVGFYRSWTRGAARLRDQDLEIFQAVERACTSYAEDFRFFMVLAPASKDVLSIQVAIRQDQSWDEWQSHRVSAQPLDSVLATPQPEALPETPRPPAPPPQPPAPPLQPVSPPPAPRVAASEPPRPAASATGARRVPAWLYGAASIVLLAGAIAVYSWMNFHPQPPVPAAGLPAAVPGARTGFAANPQGNMWKLTWNRDAVAALHPTGAVLSIRDGDNERQIPLAEADLASGMVFYTPQSGNLIFKFAVATSGSTPVEEHVRVLAAAPAVRKPAEPGVPIVGNDHNVTAWRPFTGLPESHESTSANSASAMDVHPPPVLPVPGNVALGPSVAANALLPKAPSAPPRHPEIAPVPAPVPRTLSTVVALPPARAPEIPAAPVNYIGPRPVRRVGASANLEAGGPTSVQVRVEIDAAGKVGNVEALGMNAANYRLAQAAIRAAHLWRFEPARENGRPVRSTIYLNFHFDRK